MIQIQTAPQIKREVLLNWEAWSPKRGEIYLVDLGEGMDCEQRGLRPFVILSNDVGNTMASILTGASITTRKKGLPKIHVSVGRESGLKNDSFILCEHIRTISKRRFFSRGNPVFVGSLPKNKVIELESAIKFELGFIT